MSVFADIFMRDYAGDNGQVPSDARQGLSASPDIIPWGPNPNPTYLTDFVNNYNGPYDYYQNIGTGYNYIYVRGFNNFTGTQSGSVFLYYSPGSLLCWPASWINNKILNTNGTNAATITNSAAGAVCVGQGAFYWTPPSIYRGDHFCLISQVVTQQDPNNIPSTIDDFVAWVANNANIAWRNVSIISSVNPSYSQFVTISNPVPQSSDFTLTVTCTNIPDGTTVSLIGQEQNPPINFTAQVGLNNQISTNPKVNKVGWSLFNVPGNFAESIQLSVNSTQKFGVGANVRFNYFVLRDKAHRLAYLGLNPDEYNISLSSDKLADQGIMLPLGDYTFQYSN